MKEMRGLIIPNKVVFDGVRHFLDPFITDNDRTWCGLPIPPYVNKNDDGRRAQKCEFCQAELEKENARHV